MAATSSHSRSARLLGVGAQRRAAAGGRPERPLAGGDADLDGRVVARALACRAPRGRGAGRRAAGRRSRAVAAAGARPRPRRPARPRAASRAGVDRGLEGRARGFAAHREDDALERRARPSRWRRTSSTSIRAASSSGKPPTPVPNATSARLRAPSSSARARVEAVARRMTSAEVGPPSSIVAAWITQRLGMSPAVVSTASPSAIGARARDSRSSAARRRGDRARHPAPVPQLGVRGVGDRVHRERGDVGVERPPRRPSLYGIGHAGASGCAPTGACRASSSASDRAPRGRAHAGVAAGPPTARTGRSRRSSRASRRRSSAWSLCRDGPGHAEVSRLDVVEEAPEGLAASRR